MNDGCLVEVVPCEACGKEVGHKEGCPLDSPLQGTGAEVKQCSMEELLEPMTTRCFSAAVTFKEHSPRTVQITIGSGRRDNFASSRTSQAFKKEDLVELATRLQAIARVLKD